MWIKKKMWVTWVQVLTVSAHPVCLKGGWTSQHKIIMTRKASLRWMRPSKKQSFTLTVVNWATNSYLQENGLIYLLSFYIHTLRSAVINSRGFLGIKWINDWRRGLQIIPSYFFLHLHHPIKFPIKGERLFNQAEGEAHSLTLIDSYKPWEGERGGCEGVRSWHLAHRLTSQQVDEAPHSWMCPCLRSVCSIYRPREALITPAHTSLTCADASTVKDVVGEIERERASKSLFFTRGRLVLKDEIRIKYECLFRERENPAGWLENCALLFPNDNEFCVIISTQQHWLIPTDLL